MKQMETDESEQLVSTLRGLLPRSQLTKKEETSEDASATYYKCEWFDKDGELVRRDGFVNLKTGVAADGVGRL